MGYSSSVYKSAADKLAERRLAAEKQADARRSEIYARDPRARELEQAIASCGTAAVRAVLNGGDILARERGLDSIRWEKISSLTTFSYFDLDAILGVIAKMGIVERWRALDEETGREMFQELIDETRASYGGVSYNPAQNE